MELESKQLAEKENPTMCVTQLNTPEVQAPVNFNLDNSIDELLKSSSGWLEEQRSKLMSQPVSYVRGDRSVEVPACVSRPTTRHGKFYNVSFNWEHRDFLILTRTMVLDDEQLVPQAGDRILLKTGHQFLVYEVTALLGAHCYGFTDGYDKTLRIHTKLIHEMYCDSQRSA